MDTTERYEAFLRNRISELIVQRGISEHRLSLELGKSGSYIRAITNNRALPSVKELFNIMDYFGVSPTKFFEGLDDDDSLRSTLRKSLWRLDEETLKKVAMFIEWVEK